MTEARCPHEVELLDSLASGRWPQACEAELRDHVAACRECGDLALVAESIARDRRDVEHDISVPTSGAIWWRMQMRMERESRLAAARTARRAHSSIVAVTVASLLLVLATTSLLRAGWTWLASAIPSAIPSANELTSMMQAAPSLPILALVSVAALVVTPVVLYFAVAEE
ncbi:MAG: hypothetical protein ACSLFQ_22550 [Thermoanaerobaculia bacterium]